MALGRVSIPIPLSEHLLQPALEAIGCPMTVRDDGTRVMAWPLPGWDERTVDLTMDQVHRRVQGMFSVQEVHRYLRHHGIVGSKLPDWDAVRAAVGMAVADHW